MGAGSSGPKYMEEIHTPTTEEFINKPQQISYPIFLMAFIILMIHIFIFFSITNKKRYKD